MSYIIVYDRIACFGIGNQSQGSIICSNLFMIYSYQQSSYANAAKQIDHVFDR